MAKQLFEDISSIKHGDFPASHVTLKGEVSFPSDHVLLPMEGGHSCFQSSSAELSHHIVWSLWILTKAFYKKGLIRLDRYHPKQQRCWHWNVWTLKSRSGTPQPALQRCIYKNVAMARTSPAAGLATTNFFVEERWHDNITSQEMPEKKTCFFLYLDLNGALYSKQIKKSSSPKIAIVP